MHAVFSDYDFKDWPHFCIQVSEKNSAWHIQFMVIIKKLIFSILQATCLLDVVTVLQHWEFLFTWVINEHRHDKVASFLCFIHICGFWDGWHQKTHDSLYLFVSSSSQWHPQKICSLLWHLHIDRLCFVSLEKNQGSRL